MSKIISFGIVTVVCLACFSHYSLLAQYGGLKRQYYFEDRSTIFRSIIQFDNDLVIVGQSGSDSSGLSSVFILRIDTLGNIKKLDFYQDPTLSDDVLLNHFSYQALSLTPDNGIIVAGSMFRRNNLYMFQLDSTLTLEYFKEFESDFKSRFVTRMIKLENAYYTLGIVQKSDFDPALFIHKVDLFGNFIWEKTYGSSMLLENAESAIMEDGGITILSEEWLDPSHTEFNDELNWTRIFHIDTSGEILRFWKSQENEEGNSPSRLVKSNNKYFYLLSPSHQINIQTIWHAAQVVCRDSMFNLLWRRTYSDTFHTNGFNDLVIGPDGNLITGGQISEEITWARIFKLDPEQGDIIWTVRDSGVHNPAWGSRNIIESLTVLQSGSVIGVGHTFDPVPYHEYGFLLKVTKDGCIDTLCTTTLIDDIINKQNEIVSVYPNPAYDYINFHLKDLNQELHIKVFNLLGTLLIHKKLHEGTNIFNFDEDAIIAGLHIWQVVNNKGKIIDSGKFFVLK